MRKLKQKPPGLFSPAGSSREKRYRKLALVACANGAYFIPSDRRYLAFFVQTADLVDDSDYRYHVSGVIISHLLGRIVCSACMLVFQIRNSNYQRPIEWQANCRSDIDFPKQ